MIYPQRMSGWMEPQRSPGLTFFDNSTAQTRWPSTMPKSIWKIFSLRILHFLPSGYYSNGWSFSLWIFLLCHQSYFSKEKLLSIIPHLFHVTPFKQGLCYIHLSLCTSHVDSYFLTNTTKYDIKLICRMTSITILTYQYILIYQFSLIIKFLTCFTILKSFWSYAFTEKSLMIFTRN